MKKTSKKIDLAESDIDPVDPLNHLTNTGHKFKEDFREKNPGLHMLYFTTAVEHLRAIDLAILKFGSFSNWNMSGVVVALNKERNKLVKEQAAYAEADVCFAI